MSELQELPKPPGKVQAIGICHLIGGLSNLAWACFWMLYGGIAAIGTFGLGLVFCCPVIFLLPIACLELYSAFKHLTGARGIKPPKLVAFAELSTIMVCNTFSVIPGILTLLFSTDPEVQAWYAANQDA